MIDIAESHYIIVITNKQHEVVIKNHEGLYRPCHWQGLYPRGLFVSKSKNIKQVNLKLEVRS
ncbi:hypothetical protein BHU72_13595 [Desulfuribacillus stibiiarsenatis]|uniref:Uncharacterized protein n=1 Tax=Desulfuribacillus stibiiarsenatis TaxID=1390249 RepID=A0A1E5L8G0_9FIRM|nr:hypothetical protein BHU72_13595 [Desulfuribacillus stibiiarsenatis]